MCVCVCVYVCVYTHSHNRHIHTHYKRLDHILREGRLLFFSFICFYQRLDHSLRHRPFFFSQPSLWGAS